MAEVKVTKASEVGDPSMYPSQSDNSRVGMVSSLNNPPRERPAERPKLAAVADGTVRRKSQLQEKFDTGVQYIWNDILKPALQATVVDMFGQAVNIAIYGEPQSRGRSSKGRIDVSNLYRRNGSIRERDRGRRDDFAESFEDITYGTVEDSQGRTITGEDQARSVLRSMRNQIEDYGRCSILDYYDASGMTGNSYIDDDWGWRDRDLDRVPIKSYYDRELRETRWYLDLPKPIRIR